MHARPLIHSRLSKFFQRRDAHFDPLNFIASQMLLGVMPLTALPAILTLPATEWSVTYVLLLACIAILSTAVGFRSGSRCYATCPQVLRRSTCSRFP